jgi:hypothetical protein
VFARSSQISTWAYVVGGALIYAALRTAPAYLALAGSIGLASMVALLAFAWVILLLVLAVRRRQHAVLRAAAEFVGTLAAGWILAGIITTPVRTAVDPTLTLRAIAGPVLLMAALVMPLLLLPVSAVIIKLGRRWLPGAP